MKHLRFTFYLSMILLALLAACAPQATPTATDTPTSAAPAADTDTPTAAATEAPTEVPPTPTLAPINLVPEMKVGATFVYADGATLVAVPGGPFTMGRGGSDNPVHIVTLGDFWIYRTKVTNKQYARCVAVGECTPPDLTDNTVYTDPLRVNDPVNGVTWDQGQAYCTWVHGRLPTEAEWEKTARGPDANIYPWGNGAPACDLLNYNNCVGKTTDVNKYPQGKSYYEAFDMSGNAFEWVADWYDALYYKKGAAENPLGPDEGKVRSIRSSSYKANTDQVAASVRFYDYPNHHRRDLGFRCVVEDPGYFAPACEQIAFVGPDQGGGAQGPVVIPTPDCPPVSGTSGGFCNNNVPGGEPGAHLNFNPDPLPPGTLTTMPAGCVLDPPGNLTNDYYCNVGGPASIQGYCTVPPPPVPAGCGPGYTPDPGDPKKCNWTGGGTEGTQCLPGDTYDPEHQCCSSAPGAGDTYNLCPVDAPYYAGGICVSWPSSDYAPPIPISVALGSCNPGGPGGCAPRTCTDYKASWDSDRCCCYNSFIGSCTK
jgi:sulfatase modifying factor 1